MWKIIIKKTKQVEVVIFILSDYGFSQVDIKIRDSEVKNLKNDTDREAKASEQYRRQQKWLSELSWKIIKKLGKLEYCFGHFLGYLFVFQISVC